MPIYWLRIRIQFGFWDPAVVESCFPGFLCTSCRVSDGFVCYYYWLSQISYLRLQTPICSNARRLASSWHYYPGNSNTLTDTRYRYLARNQSSSQPVTVLQACNLTHWNCNCNCNCN